jgi:hypothetical protein
MNAKAAKILTDPHPCGHIVYPYTDETLVGQAVALYTSSGLRNGEGVILIMTAAHCDSITLRLVTEGYDVESLQATGRLVCVTAEELLSHFMVDGAPDKELFRAAVGRMIRTCRASTGNGSEGTVRLFGEMVSLLWNENLGATISLEDMWNEVIEEHRVSLMCTYALNGQSDIDEALHALHNHSVCETHIAN